MKQYVSDLYDADWWQIIIIITMNTKPTLNYGYSIKTLLEAEYWTGCSLKIRQE